MPDLVVPKLKLEAHLANVEGVLLEALALALPLLLSPDLTLYPVLKLELTKVDTTSFTVSDERNSNRAAGIGFGDLSGKIRLAVKPGNDI